LQLSGARVSSSAASWRAAGLIDHHPYGDVHRYAFFAHQMTTGRWPYRDFFDEYPVLAQPLFLVVRVLPGPFATTFKWTMAVFGIAALALLVDAMRGPVLASWRRLVSSPSRRSWSGLCSLTRTTSSRRS